MIFKLFLLWSFVLLGRPQDLLTFLQPMRPAFILTIIITIAWLIFGSQKQRLSVFFSTTETKRYLLFFVIMIIGIPFAYHRRFAFEGIFLNYLTNVLFFFILVSEVNSLKRLKSLIWVICLCTFLYGFYGYLFGTLAGGRFTIYGGMFDPNDIAYILLSISPICIFYLLYREGFFKSIFVLTAILSSLMVILLTGSRGGFIGLLAVFGMMLFTKRGGIKRIHKVFFVTAMFAIYLSLGNSINVERYMTLTDIQSDYNVFDEYGRTQVWKRAIELTLDHPITGVGVDCSSMAIGFLREKLGLWSRWQSTHNSYLQVASEVGLFGFAVFALLTFQTFMTLVRASRMRVISIEALQVKSLAGLILLGFVGHSISAFFISQGYSVLFTLFFALGAVIRRLQFDLQAAAESSLSGKSGPMVRASLAN